MGIEPEPKKVLLDRGMFEESSLGYTLFPPVLNGRRRWDTTFNQPLSSLFPIRSSAWQELNERDISTVCGALSFPDADFSAFLKADQIRQRLQEYLIDLAVCPQARLLGVIFGESQTPVNPDQEQEIIDAVTEGLSGLENKRLGKVLELRYGLTDGITSSFLEIAPAISTNPKKPISRDRPRQLEQEAFRLLRQPSRGKYLAGYLTLPEHSLGRHTLGFTFIKDIPDVLKRTTVSGLALSEILLEELTWRGCLDDQSLGLDQFVRSVDVKRLSVPAIEELKNLVQKLDLAEVEDDYEDEEAEEPKEPAKPFVNNLLPEANLTEEQLTRISGLQISQLDLSIRVFNLLKKAGFQNFRDLFKCTPEEYRYIRNFGPLSALELGVKIEELLDLPKGCISGPLASAFYLQKQEEQKREKANTNFLIRVEDIIKRAVAKGCETVRKFKIG